MRTRRLAGTGLGLLAAVSLAMAGCTGNGDARPSPSVPSATASSAATDDAAAAALANATAQLGTTSFKVTMTAGSVLTVTGVVDAPNGVGTSTLEVKSDNAQLRVETLLAGQDLYVKVPGVTTAGKWMHIDVARLPEGANVGLRPGQIDPANTQRLLTSTASLQQTDPRTISGTLDLTKVAGVAGVDNVTIDGYGQAATAVPFRANLDDQGRLSVLTIDLPAAAGRPAQPLEVLYSDYGTTVAVQKPTGDQVTEAPESLYDTLGGR